MLEQENDPDWSEPFNTIKLYEIGFCLTVISVGKRNLLMKSS